MVNFRLTCRSLFSPMEEGQIPIHELGMESWTCGRRHAVLRQWVQVHGDHGFVSDYAALLWSDMQRLEEERARQCKAAEEAARQRQVQEEEARRRQIEEDLAKQRQASEEAAMLRADIEATIQRRTSEEAEKPQSEERSEDEGSDSNNPFPPAIGQLQATDEVRARVSFGWQRRKVVYATTKRQPW